MYLAGKIGERLCISILTGTSDGLNQISTFQIETPPGVGAHLPRTKVARCDTALRVLKIPSDE